MQNLSDDERSSLRNREIGFVFQSFNLFNEPVVNHRPSFPFYASNGYAVFLPDIRFEIDDTRTVYTPPFPKVDVAPDTFTTTMPRNAEVSPDGSRVVFESGGLLYLKSLPDGEPDTLNTVENVFVRNPEAGSWTITVEAVGSGTAVTWVQLEAEAADGPVSASALEVTRIIGPRGHGGGCGSHEEGGDDHTSGGDHEEGDCGSDQHGMAAACTAIDPAAQIVVLEGPFASRRYQLEGPGDVTIWVEVGESTGEQRASWRSSAPIDAVPRKPSLTFSQNWPPSSDFHTPPLAVPT